MNEPDKSAAPEQGPASDSLMHSLERMDTTGRYELCTTCGRLRTECCPVHGLVDRCLCQPMWKPERAELALNCVLCQVCGLRLVRGHYKWRFVICSRCVRWSDAFNRRVGHQVLPKGIHSIVNSGPTATGKALQEPMVRDSFATDLSEMFGAILAFSTWAEARVVERLQTFGFAKDLAIPVEQYLAACAAAGITEETGRREIEEWFFGPQDAPQ